jgi:hypothetical protein
MGTELNHSEVEERWAEGLSGLETTVQRLLDDVPHHMRAEFCDDLLLWARHQADEGLIRSIETLSAARYTRSAVKDALGISTKRFDRLMNERKVEFNPLRSGWSTPEEFVDVSHLMSA